MNPILIVLLVASVVGNLVLLTRCRMAREEQVAAEEMCDRALDELSQQSAILRKITQTVRKAHHE